MSRTLTELMDNRAYLMDRLVREMAITYGYPVSGNQLPSSMKTVLADAAEVMIEDWVHYDFHQPYASDWLAPGMIAEIGEVDALIEKRSVVTSTLAKRTIGLVAQETSLKNFPSQTIPNTEVAAQNLTANELPGAFSCRTSNECRKGLVHYSVAPQVPCARKP